MSQVNTVFNSTNLTHSGTSYKFCLVSKCTAIHRIFIVCAVLWGFFFFQAASHRNPDLQPALTQEPNHHTNTQQLCHVALINLWVWAHCIQYAVFPYKNVFTCMRKIALWL